MKRFSTGIIALIACILAGYGFFPSSVRAQETLLPPAVVPDFTPAFGITGSYSPNSFRAWGKMRNTRQMHLMLSLQHSRIQIRKLPLTLSSDIIITGWVRYPVDGADGPMENVMGLGLVPLHVQAPLWMNPAGNGFFFSTGAGFMVFGSEFPTQVGTRFNFILNTGIGYQHKFSDRFLIKGGYKLQHLSNGDTGQSNPGIDSQNLFFGILFDL